MFLKQEREQGLAVRQSGVQLGTGLYRSCAALSKVQNLPQPQFPFCRLEVITTSGDCVRKYKPSIWHSLSHSKHPTCESSVITERKAVKFWVEAVRPSKIVEYGTVSE